MRTHTSKARVLAAVAITAGAMSFWPQTADAASEGCVAAAGSSCSYVATKPAGIAATGNIWRVRVVHKGRSKIYGPANYLDVESSTLKVTNAVRRGDRVYVSTGGTVYYAATVLDESDWPPVVASVVAVGPAYNH